MEKQNFLIAKLCNVNDLSRVRRIREEIADNR